MLAWFPRKLIHWGYTYKGTWFFRKRTCPSNVEVSLAAVILDIDSVSILAIGNLLSSGDSASMDLATLIVGEDGVLLTPISVLCVVIFDFSTLEPGGGSWNIRTGMVVVNGWIVYGIDANPLCRAIMWSCRYNDTCHGHTWSASMIAQLVALLSL